MPKLTFLLSFAAAILGVAGHAPAVRSAAPFQPFVVVLDDLESAGVYELFAVNLDGSQRVKLSGPLVAGGNVVSFRWSPDRKRVAFLADKEVDQRIDLFVVEAKGGNPAKVSVPLGAGDSIAAFGWSPKSQRLDYLLFDEVGGGNFDLIVRLVDPDGSDGVEVGRTLALGNSYFGGHFAWAPNGSRYAFAIDRDVAGVRELYTCKADGSGVVRVSGEMVANGGISTSPIAWAPNGSRIAYCAEQDTDGQIELYTTRPDVSDPTKRSAPLIAAGDVGQYSWSPNGKWIAYTADQNANNVFELFVAPAAAGAVLEASGSLPSFGSVNEFAWSPDGKVLAYTADRFVDDTYELFTTRFDGKAPIRVSGLLAPGSLVAGLGWSKLDGRVTYLQFPDPFDLRSVRADGSARVSIAGNLVPLGEPFNTALSPKRDRIAFLLEIDASATSEAYAARADGTELRRVSPLGSTGARGIPTWSSKGDRVVFAADPGAPNVFRLFAATPDGGTIVPLTPGGDPSVLYDGVYEVR